MTQGKSLRAWHWFAIFCLAYAVFLAGLNRRPVPTIDGAVYASMARNVVEQNQWFPLTYQGKVFSDHPPFFVWTIAASFKLFGINDFAANFPMHLFAFLTVIMTALIARQAGLSHGVALAIAVTLCGTRDFVLSSVRGYIEPLLEFWIYFALYFAIRHKKTKSLWPVFGVVVCLGFAWFAKGPPALWPTVFFWLFFVLGSGTVLRKFFAVSFYIVGVAAVVMLGAHLVQTYDHSQVFYRYFHKQVLGSALTGRENAQIYDPLFYVHILKTYYWPWLPLLIISVFGAFFTWWRRKLLTEDEYPLTFLIYGLGFVAGFSLVKWHFWYYIAPAYPAFALAIGATVYKKIAIWLERPIFPKTITNLAGLWIFSMSTFPLIAHLDRVPEIKAFENTVRQSQVPGPVWFVQNPMDHNLIATSGEWSFHRVIEKVEDEATWARSLKGPAWILTGAQYRQGCAQHWCRHGIFMGSAGKSALVYYPPLPATQGDVTKPHGRKKRTQIRRRT